MALFNNNLGAFQTGMRNWGPIKKARIACSRWPLVIKLAKWNPFAPNLIWIVPLEIFSLIMKGWWPVSVALLLYVIYGLNIVSHTKKELTANQAANIVEMKATMTEKEIRTYCKDQAFANALNRHRKDYDDYTKVYTDKGLNIKKDPAAKEIKEWSAAHWEELKKEEEKNLLQRFGLKLEEE